MSSSRKSYIISGVVICLLGAICFSTKAIFVKLAYRDTAIEAVPLLALRMIFALPFFLVSAFHASSRIDNVKFSVYQWFYIAIMGCLGYYVSSLLDFLGLQYVSAGIERLILFIYPTMVLIISSLITRTKVNSYQWMAVGITYIGLFTAFFGEINLGGQYSKDFYLGAALIFACALTYALYLVGSGRIIPIVGAAKFNSYAMSFACLAVMLHYLFTSDQSLFHFQPRVYIYTISMAILSTVIPSYLVTEGIKRIGSSNASIVGSIGPVSTIIQANIFLFEPIFALQIAGTALVLLGVLLISKKAN